ncbi:acyl carrier protein [Sphaerisporangium fuscum]|uniref:acyl carrier protein n=1 Tax=Sphaerisporangium fuscum TaxID=2835868 RepID=UPI001BDCD28C|nr:acyl carrier protein [Sphaerisporangium fuscum]
MPASDKTLDDVAEQLVAIWKSVLKTSDIDPDSNLHDLGATSLAAVRIRSRVRAQLGKEIDIVALLEHPTPRELAVLVVDAPAWSGPQAWHQIEWTPGV